MHTSFRYPVRILRKSVVFSLVRLLYSVAFSSVLLFLLFCVLVVHLSCHLQVLYDGLISLYIPISAVALVNIVIFISVFRLAFKQRKRQSSKRQGRFRILRVAMATFILLGLSWIFGLVGLAFQQEAIDIIFTTLLAASGMLVFVVKVLLAEQVRNAVGRLLNRGVVGDSLDMPYENRRLSLTSLLNRSFNSSASSLHRHSHNSHEADCSVSSSLPSSQETPFSMAHPSRSTTTPSASNVIGISLCSITEDLPTSEWMSQVTSHHDIVEQVDNTC